ncbi:hypothetical protein R3P38DRAFT_3357492 [Favolaschia claudopus]|uniref:GATA-type domain-containing protein n=1 Tax=Favolaschia claudopus TaxID=2862362 RepID=A0AAW0B9B5_9AGAR
MVSAPLSMSLPTSYSVAFAAPEDKEAPYSSPWSLSESPQRYSPPLTHEFHFCSSQPTSELKMNLGRSPSMPCHHESRELSLGIPLEQPTLPFPSVMNHFQQPVALTDFWNRKLPVHDRAADDEGTTEGGGLSGADAVNAAFCQLLDSPGSAEKVDNVFIKLLLRRGFLPPEELLTLVDWRRLHKSLAARCVNWLLDSTVGSRNSKHSAPPDPMDTISSQCHFDNCFSYNVPSSLPQNPATHPPFSDEVINPAFVDPVPQCLSSRVSTDNSLRQALNPSPRTLSLIPAFVESGSPPPVTVSPPRLPESVPSHFPISPSSEKLQPSPDLVNPVTDISPAITISPPPSSITPEIPLPMDITPPTHPDNLHDLETSSTHIITAATDTPLAPKRRCEHCQTENTAQWRTHPEKDGHLCNACGQYLLRQGRPRPLDTINQAKSRPPRPASKDDFLVPPPKRLVPEKRGGEVIMRVFSKSARRHSHSGETSIDVDPAF